MNLKNFADWMQSLSGRSVSTVITAMIILILPVKGYSLSKPAFAQDSPIIESDSTAEYRFGQVMGFKLSVVSSTIITDATLFITISGQTTRYVAPVPMEPAKEFEVRHDLELTSLRIAPFAEITYWWRIADQDGNVIEIEPRSFEYEDDRFAWNMREQNEIVVHWTGSETDLGQAAYELVQEALPDLQSVIPVEPPQPLQIYLYPSADDIQTALRLTGREWLEAHARPELGTILVAVSNEGSAQSELSRSIPHELSHLWLYQATLSRYSDVPRWFDEGLAITQERAPNPTYDELLANAIEDGQVLSFNTLCRSFPADGETVALAYAQSGSLMSYIRNSMGDAAVTDMINALRDGASCTTFTNQALGMSLEQLTEDWLEDGNPDTWFQSFWGRGAFALMIMILFSLITYFVVVRSGQTTGNEMGPESP